MSWSRGIVLLHCCLSLLFPGSVRALIDKAGNLDELANYTNIVLVSPGEEDVATVFGGDAERFARESEEAGVLVYDVPAGFDTVSITLFTKNDPDWQLKAIVGGVPVLTLTAENVTAAIGNEVRVLSHSCFIEHLHVIVCFPETFLVLLCLRCCT